MERKERERMVALYRDGYRAVAEALHNATEEELGASPAPGKWCAREIVHHLADSEMTAAIRLRRLLTEDRPTIHGYDQEEFARRLHYDRPHRNVAGGIPLRPRVHRPDSRTVDRSGLAARRHAQRSGKLRCREVAGDLLAARPSPREADCCRPRGGGVEGLSRRSKPTNTSKTLPAFRGSVLRHPSSTSSRDVMSPDSIDSRRRLDP